MIFDLIIMSMVLNKKEKKHVHLVKLKVVMLQ